MGTSPRPPLLNSRDGDGEPGEEAGGGYLTAAVAADGLGVGAQGVRVVGG
jgi:hypothetical protein